ncbi:MAG: four helix bundle protein [Bacteroidales bacterium]|nr:four helix bundle protein [Bacteroidales bacterium]
MVERKNINRGYKKLNVWNDSILLYSKTCQLLKNQPFELKRISSNAIDAAQSISRNIAEGYCRRSIKEYLKHLYIALGSSGELHSCLYSMFVAEQITEVEFNEIDILHFQVENELIQLVKSLERKEQENDWLDRMPDK